MRCKESVTGASWSVATPLRAPRWSAKLRPRSINIFLLDGDPDGIRVAPIYISTIKQCDIDKQNFAYSHSKYFERKQLLAIDCASAICSIVSNSSNFENMRSASSFPCDAAKENHI